MDQPAPILQDRLPDGQLAMAQARLPSMRPVDPADWLWVDSAYAAQMAEKARLLEVRPGAVMAQVPGSEPAQAELLDLLLGHLAGRADFRVDGLRVTRPDGVAVTVDPADPLRAFASLVQEDLCILETRDGESVLTAAAVCFPSSWTLAEKIGRPMTRIHRPVESYDADIARRVQRMFDNVPLGVVMLRSNALRHHDPVLFHAYTEANPRPKGRPDSPFIRSERQTIRRLPRTGAVVFSIHTSVVAA